MDKKSLYHAKKGAKLIIASLPEEDIRYQLMRMGLSPGDQITCSQRLPGGTIVVKKKRQEIAIGADLAIKIMVTAK